MDVEYRWGIWSPPHAIWDLITQYVGFVSEIMEQSKTYWQVHQALRDSDISSQRMVQIYKLLPDKYKDFVRKEHMLQFDMLPNGNFITDVSFHEYIIGLRDYFEIDGDSD